MSVTSSGSTGRIPMSSRYSATSRVPTGTPGSPSSSSSISSRVAAKRVCQLHAAGLQADDDQLVEPVVALEDLVRHAPQGTMDVVGVHDL